MARGLRYVLALIVALPIIAAIAAGVLRYVVWPPIPGIEDITEARGQNPAAADSDHNVGMAMLRSTAGFRTIAMDFAVTADGEYVCGPDLEWAGASADMEAVLAKRNTDRYAPCVLAELIAWFALRPKAVLLADFRDDAVRANASLVPTLGKRLVAVAHAPDTVCALDEAGVSRVLLEPEVGLLSHVALAEELAHRCVRGAEALAVSMNGALLGHAFLARAVAGAPVYVRVPNGCLWTRIARYLGADGVITGADKPLEC